MIRYRYCCMQLLAHYLMFECCGRHHLTVSLLFYLLLSLSSLLLWWLTSFCCSVCLSILLLGHSYSQAQKFSVHGMTLNGQLTCGENIADLGGVKLALRALQAHLRSQPSTQPVPTINGFTPEQRLFLAWSQAWRENGECTSVLYIYCVY